MVIKVGGNELDDAAFLAALTYAVVAMPERPVIVHGGGKELTTLQRRLGLESRFVEGLRVTDEASLAVAEMVLRGRANLRLVRALASARVPALGLCGVDAGLILVEKVLHPSEDLGFVGRPVTVDAERLRTLLAAGFLPVLAPIGLGADGYSYNVNADHVAAAVAVALGAPRLVFLTNVPGVLRDGDPLEQLTVAEVEALIEDGTIAGGMVPKVRAAREALDAGVGAVSITNLEGLEALSQGREAGTRIVED